VSLGALLKESAAPLIDWRLEIRFGCCLVSSVTPRARTEKWPGMGELHRKKREERASAPPKLYWLLISVGGNIGEKISNYGRSALTNSKPSSEPLETLLQTMIAVERNPETLSHALASLRPFPNDSGNYLKGERQSEVAGTRPGIRSPRSESGTLWVRPWGGK
jgi:hypothetical protein